MQTLHGACFCYLVVCLFHCSLFQLSYLINFIHHYKLSNERRRETSGKLEDVSLIYNEQGLCFNSGWRGGCRTNRNLTACLNASLSHVILSYPTLHIRGFVHRHVCVGAKSIIFPRCGWSLLFLFQHARYPHHFHLIFSIDLLQLIASMYGMCCL
jgi:hypothetical protein